MKKIAYGMAAVFIVLMLSSTAKAALDVQITVGNATINPFQTQTITATTNERGAGIVLVIQPTDGSQTFTDFLNSHPLLLALWNLLPNAVQTDIIGKIGGKIVSYDLVSAPDQGGDNIVLTFPADFTGINGAPSTAVMGKYAVIFAFLSYEHPGVCKVIGIDFDIGSWFVVPEVPWGTVITLATSLCALPVFALYKRRRPM